MAEDRKGFNFYRSYYDVYLELSKADRATFIEALLERQFKGVQPTNLKGMAKFAYIGQKHNIDKQVKGWEDKTKCKLTTLITPPTEGGLTTPTQQEEEKGKEQEEEQQRVLPFDQRKQKFINWFNDAKKLHTGTKGKFQVLSRTDESNLKILFESYDFKDFEEAIPNLFKSQWAKENNSFTPSHFLRVDNFNKYLNQEAPKNPLSINPNHFNPLN